MTIPPPPQDPYGPDPYESRPYESQPYAPQSPPPPPPTYAYGYPPPPAAGFAGEQLSDRSKMAAGLLQLLPGACLLVGGIGRLYAGQTQLGIVQLVCSVVAWASAVCGIFLAGLPWVFTFGIWVWFIVDGIVLLAGQSRDGQGRLLRT